MLFRSELSNEAEHEQYLRETIEANDPTKWSSYSLDPSNPTYRETVLHLGPGRREREIEALMKSNQTELYDTGVKHSQSKDWREQEALEEKGRALGQQQEALLKELKQIQRDAPKFNSGHFPEPNIVGHTMSSMVKHEGKPTYLVDQIQSDWGQKLRDGGVRDEAKIAELRERQDRKSTRLNSSHPSRSRMPSSA